MEKPFEGKKLLILGGNPETVPLVQIANEMGIRTIVSSARKTDPAKKFAWKAHDYEGMETDVWVRYIHDEGIDGVLVGVADILVPAYSRVCEAVGFPCYATEKIVSVLSAKDKFKTTCEKFGIKGIPEYRFNDDGTYAGKDPVRYPVMVKPVDNGGGVGMSLVHHSEDMPAAIRKALDHSKQKRFIVEKYMDCDDIGMYFTFKDGECSLSCIFDRYTTHLQDGFSRVNTMSIYPSKYLETFNRKYRERFEKMFADLGIRDGVLLIAAFVEDDEFYVYDPGFRFQGEAPHLLIKDINGFDQREMLIRFALTGSQGNLDLKKADDPAFRGKYASTLWFLLREGVIGKIEGLEEITRLPYVHYSVQRLREGDEVAGESVGTERQVLTRLYIICDSEKELAKALKNCIEKVHVFDIHGNDMILPFVEAEKYIGGVLDES